MTTTSKPDGYWTLETCKVEASKYSTRTEFAKGSGGAYNKACKKGWLDEICKDMTFKNKPVGYWTLETCKEEALKYLSRGEFRRKSGGAYNKACKEEWLDEICKDMTTTGKPNGYWTLETCKEEARQYTSRSEFAKGSSGAYHKACQEDWLDEICKDMTTTRKPMGYWTLETCKVEASKYSTRTEFAKGSRSAYAAALIKGWSDEICKKYLKLKNKPRENWTLEKCRKEALKYSSRNEFKKGSIGAHKKACKERWLDEICKEMPPPRNAAGTWTFENCRKEAIKYSSRVEFANGSGGAYTKALTKGWLDEICKDMIREADGFHYMVYGIINERLMKAYVGITRQAFTSRIWNHKHFSNETRSVEIAKLSDTQFIKLTDYVYTNTELKDAEEVWANEYENNEFEILNDPKRYGYVGVGERIYSDEYIEQFAKKYSTLSEFRIGNINIYAAAQRHGILKSVCSHMTPNNPNLKWTLETCKEEARQYSSRSKFRRGSSGAYTRALKQGWLDEICKDMTFKNKPVGYWTLETCKEKARQYTSRSEFAKGSGSAYGVAQRKGWLDEICEHMMLKYKPVEYWTIEICRKEALKYISRNEFAKGSNHVYKKACKERWLDEICKDMTTISKPKGYWTFENCRMEALKYSSRNEFRKGSSSVYNKACKKGWLEEIYKDMPEEVN